MARLDVRKSIVKFGRFCCWRTFTCSYIDPSSHRRFFFILSFPTWSRSYSLGHKHTATHIFTHNSMNTTSWVLLFKYVILIITYPSCVNVPIIRFGGIALIQQTDFGTRSKVHGQRRPYQLLVCNDFEKLLELVVRLSSSHLEDIDVTARHIVGQVHQR